MVKKVLSVAFAAIMLLALLPINAFAYSVFYYENKGVHYHNWVFAGFTYDEDGQEIPVFKCACGQTTSDPEYDE